MDGVLFCVFYFNGMWVAGQCYVGGNGNGNGNGDGIDGICAICVMLGWNRKNDVGWTLVVTCGI